MSIYERYVVRPVLRCPSACLGFVSVHLCLVYLQSEERHRLPIFSGVILSISGIENVQRRTQINRLVTQHGGAYVKNLERPVKVTHLLCSSTNEEVTEKMKYAEKFNQRREAKIRLVWEEWFWDSLEYGGEPTSSSIGWSII